MKVIYEIECPNCHKVTLGSTRGPDGDERRFSELVHCTCPSGQFVVDVALKAHVITRRVAPPEGGAS